MPFSFTPLPLPGRILIESTSFADDRGYFMETYKLSDFKANGIEEAFIQDDHSFSRRAVLRGLHFQRPPSAQGKLIRIAAGAVWDVAVDIRPSSPGYGKWYGVTLSAENRRMIYQPPGFAHGFVTLSEEAHLLYKCTSEYDRAAEGGIRWNDPEIGIEWPINEINISKRDADLPNFRELF